VRVGFGGSMRKHVFGTAAVLLAAAVSGPVFAADLPAAPQAYAPPPVVVPPPIYSWTGCYVGIEGGGAFGQSRHTSVGAIVPANDGLPMTDNFNVSGGIVGGTTGCNYQISNFVIGVENDMSWTNISGTANDIPPFNVTARSSTTESWLDTLRGRVGVAWDRFFLYGTGGVAFAGAGVNICATPGCVSDSETRTGWVAGVGGEWAAWTVPAGTLTFKVEYLYADFGSGRFIDAPVPLGGGNVVPREVKFTNEIFRGGVNWKFNWP
jgi:outer membrane immunogenic protein